MIEIVIKRKCPEHENVIAGDRDRNKYEQLRTAENARNQITRVADRLQELRAQVGRDWPREVEVERRMSSCARKWGIGIGIGIGIGSGSGSGSGIE